MADEDPDETGATPTMAGPGTASKRALGLVQPDGSPRDRGIFTNADREYIVGLREYGSPQQRSNVRAKHVQRVTDSLQDFELLLELDDRTKERIFDDMPSPAIHQYLRDIVRFIYEGSDRDSDVVRHAVMAAISETEAAASERELKSVDVDISIERGPDPETALEMLENEQYHRLTLEQIGVLARRGRLDEEDWENLQYRMADGEK